MPSPSLTLTYVHPQPVLQRGSPGTEENRHGFEGGCCVKIGSTYHIFTTEMAGEPFSVRTLLAHWTSNNRLDWHRVSTLYTSSGNYDGQDPRAALWSPMPIFNEPENRWNLFYVTYRAAPNTPTQWLTNFEGRIWRAASRTLGHDGIGGPYEDVGVVLEPGSASAEWEGAQGVDSFFPYPVGDEWHAFYGSCNKTNPCTFWGVGLAKAPRLDGPWVRCPDHSPVPIDPTWVENPVVHQLDNGGYIAVFDAGPKGSIGYSVSLDGVHWSEGRYLKIDDQISEWSKFVRTPLGLVPEDADTFTVLFTAFGLEENYGTIGLAEFQLES